MNPNTNNIAGILIGVITVIIGWLDGAMNVASTWTISQWAAGVGIFGVLANLYFAWKRHVRENRQHKYSVGLSEDRRVVDCALCDKTRRETDKGVTA